MVQRSLGTACFYAGRDGIIRNLASAWPGSTVLPYTGTGFDSWCGMMECVSPCNSNTLWLDLVFVRSHSFDPCLKAIIVVMTGQAKLISGGKGKEQMTVQQKVAELEAQKSSCKGSPSSPRNH